MRAYRADAVDPDGYILLEDIKMFVEDVEKLGISTSSRIRVEVDLEGESKCDFRLVFGIMVEED